MSLRHPACKKQLKVGACKDRQCLFPKPCPALDADHSDYIRLLRELRALPGVKKVFIRSGIRYDYLLAENKQQFLDELCRYHVSGQLKIAPEHIAESTLKHMGKPGKEVYLKFVKAFMQKNKEIGKEQYLVPYFISVVRWQTPLNWRSFYVIPGVIRNRCRILFLRRGVRRLPCIIPV